MIKMANWDRDKCLELIGEFQKHEILWNPKNKGYYHAAMKEHAWMDLSRKLDAEIDDIKRKIDSLRGSYRREKNRLKRKSNLEQHSNWFAYNSMLFLDDIKDSTTCPLPEMLELDLGIVKTEPIITYPTTTTFINEEQQPQYEPPEEYVERPKRPRRHEDELSSIAQALNFIASSNVARDEWVIYGEHVGNKLRKLGDNLRIEAQHKINTLLYEAELQMYQTLQEEDSEYIAPECSLGREESNDSTQSPSQSQN